MRRWAFLAMTMRYVVSGLLLGWLRRFNLPEFGVPHLVISRFHGFWIPDLWF